MKSSKRKNKILLLIILILGISIGFAMLSTTLKINGDTIIRKNNWGVYWDKDSIKVTDGSVDSSIPVVSDDEEKNTVLTWSANLSLPGDFYEFTIDAVNSGSLDAMIINIDESVTPELPNYIKYSVTYADGTVPEEKQVFPKATKDGNTIIPTREKYKIRVEVLDTMTREDVANIPEGGISYTFSYEIQFAQADETALNKNFFSTASWNEIIAAYHNGNPERSLVYAMENNVKRKITLDLDHDGTPETDANLRIANLSKPSECNNSDYSQTACGFVIEFAELVTTHKMNYYDKSSYAHNEGEGTWGGYEKSDMRAYLTGGIYAREGIDYSGVSYFDSLPSDLKNKIITTKISSSSNRAGSTYTSFVNDKIYLLSPVEVWGNKVANADLEYDINFDKSRQLDYYDVIGAQADEDHWDKASKPVLNPDQQDWEGVPPEWSKGFWALREAYCNPSYDSSFYRVLIGGHIGWTYSVNAHGVSPAFRIAE